MPGLGQAKKVKNLGFLGLLSHFKSFLSIAQGVFVSFFCIRELLRLVLSNVLQMFGSNWAINGPFRTFSLSRPNSVCKPMQENASEKSGRHLGPICPVPRPLKQLPPGTWKCEARSPEGQARKLFHVLFDLLVNVNCPSRRRDAKLP